MNFRDKFRTFNTGRRYAPNMDLRFTKEPSKDFLELKQFEEFRVELTFGASYCVDHNAMVGGQDLYEERVKNMVLHEIFRPVFERENEMKSALYSGDTDSALEIFDLIMKDIS